MVFLTTITKKFNVDIIGITSPPPLACLQQLLVFDSIQLFELLGYVPTNNP